MINGTHVKMVYLAIYHYICIQRIGRELQTLHFNPFQKITKTKHIKDRINRMSKCECIAGYVGHKEWHSGRQVIELLCNKCSFSTVFRFHGSQLTLECSQISCLILIHFLHVSYILLSTWHKSLFRWFKAKWTIECTMNKHVNIL